jgi:thiamine-phosphate pyrophosphorylase
VLPRFHLITDLSTLDSLALARLLAVLASRPESVGVDAVQVRAKGASDREVVAWTRALVPASFLVGATCRSPEHAARARADGADYAGVGPVHATATKRGLPDPLGLDVLAATACEIPAIAIGGDHRRPGA